MPERFKNAITQHQRTFGVELPNETIERLASYFQLVQEHNPILHLVAPCTPEEFATRHVLESLTLLEYVDPNSRLADVGTGAGLPAIPCLIVRDDVKAILVESKEKKGKFLAAAIKELALTGRAELAIRQFEEVEPVGFDYVTCRALDKFAQKLPKLKKWAGDRPMLLFGGPALAQRLSSLQIRFTQKLMPLSEQRYLFLTSLFSAAAGRGESDATSSML